jgi:dTDP-4-amino-4,6-dideoxygalactose transaminase
MKFFDPKPEYLLCQKAIDAAIKNVVDKADFIMGSEVDKFEEEVISYLNPEGSLYALAVSSGTDALLLALYALDLKEGDEVITTPFTFIATVETIVQAGAKPVFVDIDSLTLNLDPDKVNDAITDKTRAIIPVHLFGLSVAMEVIQKLAVTHGLTVIEDAAQSMGATFNGKHVGTIGDFGCFSFFPSKNLGGFGDAGLVTCKNKEDYDTLKALRTHGSLQKYEHSMIGFNARMDTLQAAVLSVKLPRLERWIEQRRIIAQRYIEAFKGIEGIQCPVEPEGYRHTYNQFSICVESRNDLQAHLNEQNIPSAIYYPKPLHLQEAFANLGNKEGSFPVSEYISHKILALPVYPYFSKDNQTQVIEQILAYVGAQSCTKY